jgi:chromosome segregation ATPase
MKPGYNNDIQIDPKLFIPPKPMNKKEEENQRMIEYYKMKIAEIEKERIEWMTKLEGLNQNTQDFYTKEWELRKLTDEITELQQSLSEANIALNQERKKVIHFNNEIESFKNKTKDDRRRMVQLLQFAEPIENSMKTYFDRRPDALEKPERNIYEQNSVSLKKNINRNKNNSKNKNIITNRKTPSDGRQNKIKTIMFPTDTKENFVNDENKTLKKQLEEIKALYENIILKMEEDSKLRDEEIRLQTINMNQKLLELKKRKNRLEKLNFDITKNFMDLKYDTDKNNKRLNEELELTKLQNEALKNSLNDIIKKANIEKEVSKNEYNRKTKQVANSLRNQVKKKEENANLVKEQYKEIEKIYADKLNELENKYNATLDKYNDLIGLEKENSQIEKDYIENIQNLRNSMKKYEMYIKKLKKLTQGEESNSKVIEHITEANNGKFISDSDNTLNEITAVREQLIADLKEYKKRKYNNENYMNPQFTQNENEENSDEQNENNDEQNENNNNEINNDNYEEHMPTNEENNEEQKEENENIPEGNY